MARRPDEFDLPGPPPIVRLAELLQAAEVEAIRQRDRLAEMRRALVEVRNQLHPPVPLRLPGDPD